MNRFATMTAVAALSVGFGYGGTAMADDTADGVDSISIPGAADVSGDDADGGIDALGSSDGDFFDNETFTSLGFDDGEGGGNLVLNFNDNVCLDDGTTADDFTVFEIDGDAEGAAEQYDVEVGLQGDSLTALSASGTGTTNFDINADSVPFFNQISITATNNVDDDGETNFSGADIDAVQCLNSATTAVMDIKLWSDPNGYNCKKKGVLPVTIFGDNNIDVEDIDLDTVMLCLASDPSICTGPPVSSSTCDRGGPGDAGDDGAPIEADCVGTDDTEGIPDGDLDLDVGFVSRDVVADLLNNCDGLERGDLGPIFVVTGDFISTGSFFSVPTGDSGADQLTIKNK